MRTLALDISTSTGYAIFEGMELFHAASIGFKSKKIDYKQSSSESTQAMIGACNAFVEFLKKTIQLYNIDQIVIEQTNAGRSRFSQKLLEWLHWNACITTLEILNQPPIYIDSSQWRKKVGLALSKEEKKHNQNVSKKKAKGRITKKHLAVNLVNRLYDFKLKLKDNDIADAILVGRAYLIGDINGI